MPLPKDFPSSPYAILHPDQRWQPDRGREGGIEGQEEYALPPLVHKLRVAVHEWRGRDYPYISSVSRALLHWWFQREHKDSFRYYFAQQEAIETVIFLTEAAKTLQMKAIADGRDLAMFATNPEHFSNPSFSYEPWRRFVIKMATGSGKTKVLSLALVWSYFHKTYVENSTLARHFLLIAPNIIVLDRLRVDFESRKIFFEDPLIPDKGYQGFDWDFQLDVHVQTDIRRTPHPKGNLFLTNIQRIYPRDDTKPPDNREEEFLGKKAVSKTLAPTVDLRDVVKDLPEIAIFNDEAHHIHDKELAWSRSLFNVHDAMVDKGQNIALQLDVSATPRDSRGHVFPLVTSDYPLVEAIGQGIVKTPVLPKETSQDKLQEKTTDNYAERYADYINLGIEEWREYDKKYRKQGKKAILFIMTMETKQCDEVAEYVKSHDPELADAVFVIHTKRDGSLLEKNPKDKKDLDQLRLLAKHIDSNDNPYKVVVSVMVLKEGWDVRHVTTIVGLRPYTAPANILPEQTLGRGLRLSYPERREWDGYQETVSVVGTDAFIEFIRGLKKEGVNLLTKDMGAGKRQTPLYEQMVITVDLKTKLNKTGKGYHVIEGLNIEIPVPQNRLHRDVSDLASLRVEQYLDKPIDYKIYSEEELNRVIVFEELVTGEEEHETILKDTIQDSRSAVRFLVEVIRRDCQRMNADFHILYGKVKVFITDHLFGKTIDFDDRNTMHNLNEPHVRKTIRDTFKRAINAHTVKQNPPLAIVRTISLKKMRSFYVKKQECYHPSKSVFNKVIGDQKSGLELDFARFLDKCQDIVSFAQNHRQADEQTQFKLDYIASDGRIAFYYPDFFVKKTAQEFFVVETRGPDYADAAAKMARLRQWCADIKSLKEDGVWNFVFVDGKTFYEYKPKSFADLIKICQKYQH